MVGLCDGGEIGDGIEGDLGVGLLSCVGIFGNLSLFFYVDGGLVEIGFCGNDMLVVFLCRFMLGIFFIVIDFGLVLYGVFVRFWIFGLLWFKGGGVGCLSFFSFGLDLFGFLLFLIVLIICVVFYLVYLIFCCVFVFGVF